MTTRVIRVDPVAPEADRIAEAAAVVREGGLVAFPTETVYGLGANALDATAVARIFAAKGRPATDPVIVHIADAAQLDAVARDVPEAARVLAGRFWPGALTFILPKAPAIPDVVTAGLSTVGVRVPAHPVARMLIAASGVPVAAPSANVFSRPSPTQAAHVLADLEGRVDVVVDGGPTAIGVESTILDLTVFPPLIRRPGGVTAEAISAVMPGVRATHEMLDSGRPQPAPGQLLRHYAPRASLTLYLGSIEAVTRRLGNDARAAVAAGWRVGILSPEEDLAALAPRLAAIGGGGRIVTMPCGSRANRAEAARELFRALRALDAEAVDVIFASAPAGAEIDAAIVDRLTRAAEGRVVFA